MLHSNLKEHLPQDRQPDNKNKSVNRNRNLRQLVALVVKMVGSRQTITLPQALMLKMKTQIIMMVKGIELSMAQSYPLIQTSLNPITIPRKCDFQPVRKSSNI